MKFTRSLRLLLAVALLFAWTNALVHPIEHVDEAGAFVHLAGGHEGENRNGDAPDPLCDALAAVAACLSGSPNLVVASFQGGEAAQSAGTGYLGGSRTLAYRSQAPPQFS